MKENHWGGKTGDEWIDVMENGNIDKRGSAMYALQEMLTYAYATGQKTYFKIAQAVASRTQVEKGSNLGRAYGVLGVLTRYFAFDLLKGDDQKKHASRVALQAMIREAKELPEALIIIVPDLANEMVGKSSTTAESFDALVAKLTDERARARGNLRKSIDAAITHIGNVRDK